MTGLFSRLIAPAVARARWVLVRKLMSWETRQTAPVFIVGAPRSGTSALAWAISEHPAFWTSAESDYLLELFGTHRLRNAHAAALANPSVGWLRKHDVGYQELARHMGIGAHFLFLSRSLGKRWVDQTPSYTLMVDDLLFMFPAAKFIHLLRDGRLVANSLLHSGFEKLGVEYVKDFAEIARTWSFYATKGHQLAERHPSRCLEVRHEDLVSDPESVFRRIFDFLGAGYCQGSADFIRGNRLNSSYDEGQKSRVAICSDADRAAKRPSPDDWEPEMKARFREIAGPSMTELGYPLPGSD